MKIAEATEYLEFNKVIPACFYSDFVFRDLRNGVIYLLPQQEKILGKVRETKLN